MPRIDLIEIIPARAPLRGTCRVPGSKSALIRMLVCAALASGESRIRGAGGSGRDAERAIAAFEALGIPIRREAGGESLCVRGGSGRFPRAATLEVGDAGTVGRFLTALACLAPGAVRILAAGRLPDRPMEDLLAALERLGATVSRAPGGSFPLIVRGAGVRGGEVEVAAGVSSQFLSALLLLGAALPEGLSLRPVGDPVSRPYLELTCRVLQDFGVTVIREPEAGLRVPPGPPVPAEVRVPTDASSALFAWAAAAVTGGEIRVGGWFGGYPQADLAALDVLERAGCRIERDEAGISCAGRPTRGLEADLRHLPDAAPALAVVAATLPAPSRLEGLEALRFKESDRLAALEDSLRSLGVEVRREEDGAAALEIRGPWRRGAEIDPRGDHRLAMAFAVLGLSASGMRVGDPGCVGKSWPGFWNTIEELRETSR